MQNISKKYSSLCIVFFCFFYARNSYAMEFIWMGRPVKDRVNDLIEFLLNIVGSLVLLLFIVSGIMYAFSAGDINAANKAKKMFYSALLGAVLVLSSYSIIFLIDTLLTN